jgi:hypothetical protein
VRWPDDTTRGDAVARLVEAVNCSRLSGLRQAREPSESAGTVIVEYNWNEYGEKYQDTVTLTQDVAQAVGSSNISTDTWIRTADRSASIETIQAPWMIDDGGALELARWASRRNAIGARELDLMVDARLADGLLLGSVVLVEVPSLSLSDAIAIVAGRTLTDSTAWPMRLILLSPVGLDRQEPATGRITDAPTVIPDPVQG